MKHLGLLVSITVLCGGLLAYTGVAQPVRREVLKELRIEEVGGCQVITAELHFPVALLGYAPVGENLLVVARVTPLAPDVLPSATLATREALVPDPEIETALLEVTWEGADVTDPQLLFRFDRVVAYDLTTGHDFRSIVISLFPQTDDPAPCAGSEPAAPLENP